MEMRRNRTIGTIGRKRVAAQLYLGRQIEIHRHALRALVRETITRTERIGGDKESSDFH